MKATPFIGKFKNKYYPAAYSPEDRELYNFNKTACNKTDQKNKLCNAGYNVGVITPDGNIWPCLHIHNKIGHIYKGIFFNDYILRCPVKNCFCPLNVYNKALFTQAVKETKNIKRYPAYIQVLSRLRTLMKMIS